MRVPPIGQLLDLWEKASGQPPSARVLSLLELAWPEHPREELARLPIGERDGLLARLHAALFSPRQEVVVDCPHCRERLECSLDLGRLYQGRSERCGEVVVGGRIRRFRVPDSTDLLAVAHLGAEEARKALLARCLEEDLSPAEAGAVERAMEEADPRANILIALRCPACDHRWQALFDLVASFWRKLEEWLRRQLVEVHLLARAYGWSEGEILAMSPRRRRIYLEMLT